MVAWICETEIECLWIHDSSYQEAQATVEVIEKILGEHGCDLFFPRVAHVRDRYAEWMLRSVKPKVRILGFAIMIIIREASSKDFRIKVI